MRLARVSQTPFGRTLYPLGLALWTAAFAWRSTAVSRAAAALAGSAQRLADEAAALDGGSRRLKTLALEARAQSLDARFLDGLLEILPQDRGYLRTQKAIAEEVSALRAQVSRRLKGALHLLVDAKVNKLYVKRGSRLLWEADVSVGRGGRLLDPRSGRRWEFVTPRGEFRVIGKAADPQWRKPDWAFVEAAEPVPPPDDPARLAPGELGAYVLDLGDGYLIHGTRREELLGRPASHGCVRVGAAELARLYDAIPIGTRVYIFQ